MIKSLNLSYSKENNFIINIQLFTIEQLLVIFELMKSYILIRIVGNFYYLYCFSQNLIFIFMKKKLGRWPISNSKNIAAPISYEDKAKFELHQYSLEN